MSHWTELIFSKAYKYYHVGRVADSFNWFVKGALAGNTSCMIWVGVLYGDGIKPDFRNQKEIKWYKKAWKKGELSSANNLAIVYKNQRKYGLAEKWFKLAIAKGDGDANLELAKLYIHLKADKGIIIQYLNETIESDYVTEASAEEASSLMDKTLESGVI
ncbi:tetratricopeptide repeat protein [Zooshikella sp. RANM57]|uniref:tetratricopeptide repeat protein n=1 Tax=Zooshikella sp. RANM57 TaxID=3425863 RepID=UPI003D6F1F03